MKWKIAVCLEFANNFGNLAEDSSHNFWDVDSSKIVEGMKIFTRFAKTLVSKDPRVCNSGSFSEQFLKKRLFGLMKLQSKITIFHKTPFPRIKELGKSVLTYLIIQFLFQY